MHFPPSTLDLGFSHAVQSFQPSWLTAKMILITNIMSPEVMLVVGVLLTWYFWMHRKHPQSTLTAVAILGGNLWTYVLKYIMQRPRPLASDVHVLIHETGYSLPSGHAIGIVLLIAAWYILTPRKLRTDMLAVGIAMALLVGFSRVYLGVHWISDVLAGYAVALLWTGLVLMVAGRYKKR